MTTPVLRRCRHATPFTLSLVFFSVASPLTHLIVSSPAPAAPAISIVLLVCIHPYVVPIPSRFVVLLYMALSLATAAKWESWHREQEV